MRMNGRHSAALVPQGICIWKDFTRVFYFFGGSSGWVDIMLMNLEKPGAMAFKPASTLQNTWRKKAIFNKLE